MPDETEKARHCGQAGRLMFFGPNSGGMTAAPPIRSHSQGGNPADTLIELVAKFELVINLKDDGAFGPTIAPALLARADEVIG